MARDDWAVLVTNSQQEYAAQIELQRFGLHPYLPQIQRRYRPNPYRFVPRRYPLFPRYLFLPIQEVTHQAIALVHQLRRISPILADAEGRPWRALNIQIQALKEHENAGDFDETLRKGDKIKFSKGPFQHLPPIPVTHVSIKTLELFVPILGGARLKTPQTQVTRVKVL